MKNKIKYWTQKRLTSNKNKSPKNDYGVIKFNIWKISMWGILAGLFINVFLSRQVLSYPHKLYFVSLLLGIMLTFPFFIKKTITLVRNAKKVSIKIKYIGYHILYVLVYAFFVCIIVQIPIKYYIIYGDKASNQVTVTCEIESISYGKSDYTIRFNLNGYSEHLNSRESIVKSLYESQKSGRTNNYVLQLKLRESLFKTYVVESWDVVEKSSPL